VKSRVFIIFIIRPTISWFTSAAIATTSPTLARSAAKPSSDRTTWNSTGNYKHMNSKKKATSPHHHQKLVLSGRNNFLSCLSLSLSIWYKTTNQKDEMIKVWKPVQLPLIFTYTKLTQRFSTFLFSVVNFEKAAYFWRFIFHFKNNKTKNKTKKNLHGCLHPFSIAKLNQNKLNIK
jgi:hypothetical protein